jgi:hypothetical protein
MTEAPKHSIWPMVAVVTVMCACMFFVVREFSRVPVTCSIAMPEMNIARGR